MDRTITSTQICVSIPDQSLCLDKQTCGKITGQSLCLDYELPVVQKIFTNFFQKYPLIPDYKNCSSKLSEITCPNNDFFVAANMKKRQWDKLGPLVDQLMIVLGSRDGTFETLNCAKNSCMAGRQDGSGYMIVPFEDRKCMETILENQTKVTEFNTIPCDGEVPLFDKYLKQGSFTLDAPESVPPHAAPNAPNTNAPIGGPSSSPSPANPSAGPKPAPSPNTPSAPSSGPSGNSSSQNTYPFSSLQKGLGVAATIFLAYKASKEMKKMAEESKKDEGSPQLKTGTKGQTVSAGSNKKGFGSRAAGYGGAAIVAGAFTLYTMRA